MRLAALFMTAVILGLASAVPAQAAQGTVFDQIYAALAEQASDEATTEAAPETRVAQRSSLSFFSLFGGSGLSSKYRRTLVNSPGKYAPGTIVINTAERHLYHIQADGKAMRYGVGVGRQGFLWKGSAVIGRKAEWPGWTPPPAMRKREPWLPAYMPGGPDNPLGARALYLYRDGKDTLYRIHGTSQPDTIGQAVSSGCIRLYNDDIVHLYELVRPGTRVVVL